MHLNAYLFVKLWYCRLLYPLTGSVSLTLLSTDSQFVLQQDTLLYLFLQGRIQRLYERKATWTQIVRIHLLTRVTFQGCVGSGSHTTLMTQVKFSSLNLTVVACVCSLGFCATASTFSNRVIGWMWVATLFGDTVIKQQHNSASLLYPGEIKNFMHTTHLNCLSFVSIMWLCNIEGICPYFNDGKQQAHLFKQCARECYFNWVPFFAAFCFFSSTFQRSLLYFSFISLLWLLIIFLIKILTLLIQWFRTFLACCLF